MFSPKVNNDENGKKIYRRNCFDEENGKMIHENEFVL